MLLGLRRAAVRAVPLLLLGVLPLGLTIATFSGSLDHYFWDFRVFWNAGNHVLSGHSPYPTPGAASLANQNAFVYPPEAALAFVPFALLPYHVAAPIFLCILLGAILLTLRVLGVSDWRCYGASFLMAPVFSATANGAISCLLALALALAWRYRHSRAGAAGAVMGAVVAKVFLWPLLVWLLATRRSTAALAAVVGGGILTLASWAVLGFAGLGNYAHVLRVLAHAEQAKGFSPIALGLASGLPPGWARGCAVGLGVAALLTIFVLARRSDGDRLSLSAAIGAALLLSPIVWLHYFVLLLVPLAISRPRFTPLWVLAPLPFWFASSSGQSGGHAAMILLAWIAATWMLVLGTRRPKPLPRLALKRASMAAATAD
jgi:alpha-1,2-mannosyltransferase